METPGLEPLLEGGAMEQALDSANEQNGNASKTCHNCGSPLTGKFCSNCGQKDMPKRQTLGELITNFVSSIWSYESKFIQTTRYLLFRPGLLAIEYTQGKRETYYHPARMYVFISFVFFLLFFSLPDQENKNSSIIRDSNGKMDTTATLNAIREDLNEKDSAVARFLSPEFIDSLKRANANRKKDNNWHFNLGDKTYKSVPAYDSMQNLLPPEKKHNALERALVIRGIELTEKFKESPEEFGKAFKQMFLQNLPNVFFFLLPIFALLLKLLYIRRDFYYSEHLVFSIYYYNFIYLAGSIALLASYIPWIGWAAQPGFYVWSAIYFYLGMKHMYRQGSGKTVVKYLLFGSLFSFCLMLGIFINLMIVLYKV